MRGTMMIIVATVMATAFVSAAFAVVPAKGSSPAGAESFQQQGIAIVANLYNDDVGWLRDAGVPVHLCPKPGAAAVAEPGMLGACAELPVNKGREASAYLAYIVQNYDRLPERVAFIHGHREAWHQQHPRGLLAAISEADERHGFVSLNVRAHGPRGGSRPYDRRDRADMGPYSAAAFELLERRWDSHFREFLGDMPDQLFHDCCAQFVVSRERIRRLPLRAYQTWLNLLLEEERDYDLGLALEFIWHWIFGEHPVCRDRDGELCTPESYLAERFRIH